VFFARSIASSVHKFFSPARPYSSFAFDPKHHSREISVARSRDTRGTQTAKARRSREMESFLNPSLNDSFLNPFFLIVLIVCVIHREESFDYERSFSVSIVQSERTLPVRRELEPGAFDLSEQRRSMSFSLSAFDEERRDANERGITRDAPLANELIIRVHCAHVIRDKRIRTAGRNCGRNDVGGCNKQCTRRRKNAAAKQIGPRRTFGRSE